MNWPRLSRDSVGRFLDFAGANGGEAWRDIAARQLDGTVAIFNRLGERRVAWLADEVGMGKTYIALGVLSLVRHLEPSARVLVLLPSSRLQSKWVKEHAVVARSIVKVSDHRARTLQGQPARPLHPVANLGDLASSLVTDPERDVVASISAFSFPLGREPAKWEASWKKLQGMAPSIPDLPTAARNDKDVFKRHYAAALNAILPEFDLVILDESHNLKRGPHGSAARNQTLAVALGGHRDDVASPLAERLRPRVKRLLCMSATPVESDYAQLVRQAEVFGLGAKEVEDLGPLADVERDDAERKQAARSFVIRRLNRMSLGTDERVPPLTKNLYRREWRYGGLERHDAPMELATPRERLTVALVQKKVSELLHHTGRPSDGTFLPSFQMGMLSSFESFFETLHGKTAVVAVDPDLEEGGHAQFDMLEQTKDAEEQKGIDTVTLDALASSFRDRFKRGLPHPKMDRAAKGAADAMLRGEKSLVFVRRVRTVEELAARAARMYDEHLLAYLRQELPPSCRDGFEEAIRRYDALRKGTGPLAEGGEDEDDEGGSDTFFTWYFRGAGEDPHRTGAWFRKSRIQSPSARWSILFHDNTALRLFGDAERLGSWIRQKREALEDAARRYFPRVSETTGWRHRFEAWQAAALHLLEKESPPGVDGNEARLVRHALYPKCHDFPVEGTIGEPEIYLLEETLFSEVRASGLGDVLWPEPKHEDAVDHVREREIRRELLASTIRLGHPTIDLWLAAVEITGRLEGTPGRDELTSGDLARAFLARLRRQREAGQAALSSWNELSNLAEHHDLLVATNFAAVHDTPLDALPRFFQSKLSRQSPVLGMHGGSKSEQAMTQFRMPGYPFVIVSTDILQEGVDLHTFCARVLHYGIAHTSSATEQRTGRVDRIGCLVQRRLEAPDDEDRKLQVHYPHLMDTVEPLQLQVLYERMDRFLRLLHEGLGAPPNERSHVDVDSGMQRVLRYPQPVATPLVSAFEVQEGDLDGEELVLDVETPRGAQILEAWLAYAANTYDIELEHDPRLGMAVGEAWLRGDDFVRRDGGRKDARRQPFTIRLDTRRDGRGLRFRLLSPVGRLGLTDGRRAGRILNLLECDDLTGLALCDMSEGCGTVGVRCDLAIAEDTAEVRCLDDAVLNLLLGADWLEQQLIGGDAALSSFRKLLGNGEKRGRTADGSLPGDASPAGPMRLSDLRAALRGLEDQHTYVSPAGRLVVDVQMGDRRQGVRVREQGDWYRLESRIGASADTGMKVLDLTRWILDQNFAQEFVALARDEKHWLVGRVDLPRGMPTAEVMLQVRRLARTCDWWEAVMDGEDRW